MAEVPNRGNHAALEQAAFGAARRNLELLPARNVPRTVRRLLLSASVDGYVCLTVDDRRSLCFRRRFG